MIGGPEPAGGRTRPVRQLPEPARFWIAFAPRSWRFSSEPWTDLASGGIGGFKGRPAQHGLPELDPEDLDDLLYLPPVDGSLADERDRLSIGLLDAGVPVLLQLRPGEKTGAAGAEVVYDLLNPLLAGELERLATLPSGSTAVWPLIPGVTDHPETCDEGCELLAAAGVRCVQPLTVELDGKIRRRLAEGRDEDAFDSLFHGQPPSERDFACQAAGHGLETFYRRPETGETRRRRGNRKVAAHLALAAELWLRLGRSVSVGQGFFRAARAAEASAHDLAALAEEGNLKVMDWLDPRSLELVQELLAVGTSRRLERLRDLYLRSADDEESEAGGEEE